MTPAIAALTCHSMSLPSDDTLPPSPTVKPKLSVAERRIRQEGRLKTIRLRMAIRRELDERGATTPVEIGAAFGMPAAEAVKLMSGQQWREGDVALPDLQAFATSLARHARASRARRLAAAKSLFAFEHRNGLLPTDMAWPLHI